MQFLPTSLERDGWFLTVLDIVQPQQCDSMGHLTVREYMGFFDVAEWHTFIRCGFEPGMIEARRLGYADVNHQIRYQRETRVGETVAVRSAVTGFGRTSINARHELWSGTTGVLAAFMDSVSLQFDTDARKAVPLIPEIRQRIGSMVVQVDDGAKRKLHG